MNIRPSLRALLAGPLALGVTLAFNAGFAGAATHHDPSPSVHAIFVETDASANQVFSYLRNSDGTFALAGQYLTGGTGASATGAVADPLASQSGLTLFDHNTELAAVNPGSNTVSLFSVNGTTLKLTQIIYSDGIFPNSVSAHGNLVAVLNAGGTGSVAEFQLVGNHLKALPGEVRSLGLANTTPPNFLRAPGQIGYTPNGQHLVVTTKLSTNSYDVFSVTPDGTLGANPTVTAANNAVPFAFNFDANGHLLGVEASNSSLSTYTVNADGTLTSIGSISDGAKALCWVSSARGYIYGDNAGSASVSSFTQDPTGAPVLVNAAAATAHPGTTDSAVSPDGQYLYVQSGGTGALDSYRINTDGSLSQVQTLWNLPLAAEGIAVS